MSYICVLFFFPVILFQMTKRIRVVWYRLMANHAHHHVLFSLKAKDSLPKNTSLHNVVQVVQATAQIAIFNIITIMYIYTYMFILLFANIKLYKHFLMSCCHRRYRQLRTKVFFPPGTIDQERRTVKRCSCIYCFAL